MVECKVSKKLTKAFPFKMQNIKTNNGTEFTYKHMNNINLQHRLRCIILRSSKYSTNRPGIPSPSGLQFILGILGKAFFLRL